MRTFIILAAVAFISVVSAKHAKPSFYWREYKGQVPDDALKVAQHGSKVPIYVGQAYFDGHGILPGMIKPGVQELEAVADGQILKATEQIKIMATDSRRPDTDFQWISITYPNMHNLGKLEFLDLLNGGTESHNMVYIGRHSGPDYYTNIGKISTLEPYQGLSIPDVNGNPTVYKNYEVLAMLTFDCDEPEPYNYVFKRPYRV